MNDLPYTFVLGIPAIIVVLLIIAHITLRYSRKKFEEKYGKDGIPDED